MLTDDEGCCLLPVMGECHTAVPCSECVKPCFFVSIVMREQLLWCQPLAEIVHECCKPCFLIRRLRRDRIDHRHGVLERIALRMKVRGLRLPLQCIKLGEGHAEEIRCGKHAKEYGGSRGMQRMAQLCHAAFRRLCTQLLGTGAHIVNRTRFNHIAERRRLPCSAQGADRILGKMYGNGADNARHNIRTSAVGIQQAPLRQLQRHRIHGCISTVKILLNRHRNIHCNGKAAIARPRFALLACKGDLAPHTVHTDMIHREGFANLFRMWKKCAKALLIQPRQNIVHILCRHTAKMIAHTAAHAKDTGICAAQHLYKIRFSHRISSLF